MILNQRKHTEALSKAQEMEAKQDAETTTLGRTFIRDADEANAFSKLSRYEAAIERSLYKALHELQRLQAARHANSNVTPPVAIDVDVSGVSRDEHKRWLLFLRLPESVRGAVNRQHLALSGLLELAPARPLGRCGRSNFASRSRMLSVSSPSGESSPLSFRERILQLYASNSRWSR